MVKRKPDTSVKKEVVPPTDIILRQFISEPRDSNHSLVVTSANTSTYRLVNDTLSVGDTAHFVIQAKDADGRNKTSGGDFWFPVLTSVVGANPTTGGRTAGSVADHNNGTYSVFFYCGWEGTAHINIALAAPSEATKWLREKFWPIERRIFWTATFVGGAVRRGKPVTEATLCYLLRNVTSSQHCIVDYNPKATGLTALYCEKPKKALTCDNLRTLKLDVNAITNRAKQLIGAEANLFEGANWMQRLLQGPQNVSIAAKSPNMTRVESRIPDCQPDAKRLVNDGFWLDQKWNHLQCKVRRWDDPRAVKECLRHKYVYILADSTVRSWYGEITRKLDLPWKHLGKGKYTHVMDSYLAQTDLNMTFRFYPRVVTKAPLSLNTTLYEVDLLDGIPSQNCSRYILVFSPWAHLAQWTQESFTERALLLRKAILRFRERCPDVPIVVKGSFPREHVDTTMAVVCHDYTLWALGRKLRQIFRGTGVYYYDVWQMSMAYGPSHIHMPTAVISEEVNWLLSYVCGENTHIPSR